MDRDQIRNKIASILTNILDEDVSNLKDSTTAEEIDGWDSISHVKLVVALEAAYKIRFESDQITAPENVGQLVDLISSKVGS